MRRLSEKLERLSPRPGAAPKERSQRGGAGAPIPARIEADSKAGRIARLRGMIESYRAVKDGRGELTTNGATPALHREANDLPGIREDTALGPVRCVRHVLEPDHCHGRVSIARALRARPSTLSVLARDERWAHVDPRRLVFLDTETTGLSRGAGTLAFLVGLAFFEDESLVMEQLVLEEPGREKPMLHRLKERLAEASGLVTYNGRAYDWPLLTTRFVLNRVPLPSVPPHLDLLSAARRVYRPRLGGVRLVKMEEEVLGMRRERDVDGVEIPGLFWSFVRHRDGTELRGVIEHNAHDVVALAALLACFADRYERLHHADDPRDHLGWAQLAREVCQERRVLDFGRAAAEGGGEPDLTARAYLLVADAHRRAKRWEDCRSALDEAVASAVPGSLLSAKAHWGLAKLWEHRFKSPETALAHARFTAQIEGGEAHARRVARLAERMVRSTQAKGQTRRSLPRWAAHQARVAYL